MYVRWQRRSRKRRGGSPLLTAVLVECHRVDGEPRQRTLGYLAGIREKDVGNSPFHHEEFWSAVDARLDALRLDGETRSKVESQIAARVPRLSPEARAAFHAELERRRRAHEAAGAAYRRWSPRRRVTVSPKRATADR